MEAARNFPSLRPPRRPDETARELEQLRPLGEAFLLRRFAGQLDRADAEDAVAEVVIRLHRKIEAGKPPRNLRAIFFTSARNAAIDQLRSRGARPTTALDAAADAPAEQPAPSEHALARENALRLQEALGRMRGNYREAIVLRFGLGLSVPEIAKRLQISLPAAKKLLLRATEQARRRLEAIEGAEFCPEAQGFARSLVDRELTGLAESDEQRLLLQHLRHCGACRSFLAELRSGLHELGGSALLAGVASQRSWLGIAGHLGRLLDGLSGGAQAAAGRLRLAAYKASGAFSPGDATSAGALTGTAQKALAICGAATATTATCLATGIIGPGLGAGAATHHPVPAHRSPTAALSAAPEPPPEVASSPPAEQPTPSPAPSAPAAASHPEAPPPEPTPTPSAQASEEFGFESSAPPPEPASAPESASSPPPSSSTSSESTGGGGRSGAEHFGFGG